MSEPQDLLAKGPEMPADRGVTVVIPSYEGWLMLERTLTCIEADAGRLDQACQIVVVDNGSSAGTRRKMRQFARRSKVRLELVLRDLADHHFRPGTARNIGVGRALYDQIVFFDADCIPAAQTLTQYCAALDSEPETIFIGHREFIDATELCPGPIARDRALLEVLPSVRSASNYKDSYDRRLDDLYRLDRHHRPYDCLHGCNFAMSRRHFQRGVRFDRSYDGAWGYEDIDLGYQLHQRGSSFRYLPDAFVYHQEATEPPGMRQRNEDRLRNIRILDGKVGDFIAYREKSTRICPLPLGIAPDPSTPDRLDRGEPELRPELVLPSAAASTAG